MPHLTEDVRYTTIDSNSHMGSLGAASREVGSHDDGSKGSTESGGGKPSKVSAPKPGLQSRRKRHQPPLDIPVEVTPFSPSVLTVSEPQTTSSSSGNPTSARSQSRSRDRSGPSSQSSRSFARVEVEQQQRDDSRDSRASGAAGTQPPGLIEETFVTRASGAAPSRGPDGDATALEVSRASRGSRGSRRRGRGRERSGPADVETPTGGAVALDAVPRVRRSNTSHSRRDMQDLTASPSAQNRGRRRSSVRSMGRRISGAAVPATTTGAGYNPFSANAAMEQVIEGQRQRQRGASEDARRLGMLTTRGRQGSSKRSFFGSRTPRGSTGGMHKGFDFSVGSRGMHRGQSVAVDRSHEGVDSSSNKSRDSSPAKTPMKRSQTAAIKSQSSGGRRRFSLHVRAVVAAARISKRSKARVVEKVSSLGRELGATSVGTEGESSGPGTHGDSSLMDVSRVSRRSGSRREGSSSGRGRKQRPSLRLDIKGMQGKSPYRGRRRSVAGVPGAVASLTSASQGSGSLPSSFITNSTTSGGAGGQAQSNTPFSVPMRSVSGHHSSALLAGSSHGRQGTVASMMVSEASSRSMVTPKGGQAVPAAPSLVSPHAEEAAFHRNPSENAMSSTPLPKASMASIVEESEPSPRHVRSRSQSRDRDLSGSQEDRASKATSGANVPMTLSSAGHSRGGSIADGTRGTLAGHERGPSGSQPSIVASKHEHSGKPGGRRGKPVGHLRIQTGKRGRRHSLGVSAPQLVDIRHALHDNGAVRRAPKLSIDVSTVASSGKPTVGAVRGRGPSADDDKSTNVGDPSLVSPGRDMPMLTSGLDASAASALQSGSPPSPLVGQIAVASSSQDSSRIGVGNSGPVASPGTPVPLQGQRRGSRLASLDSQQGSTERISGEDSKRGSSGEVGAAQEGVGRRDKRRPGVPSPPPRQSGATKPRRPAGAGPSDASASDPPGASAGDHTDDGGGVQMLLGGASIDDSDAASASSGTDPVHRESKRAGRHPASAPLGREPEADSSSGSADSDGVHGGTWGESMHLDQAAARPGTGRPPAHNYPNRPAGLPALQTDLPDHRQAAAGVQASQEIEPRRKHSRPTDTWEEMGSFFWWVLESAVEATPTCFRTF